MKFFEQSLFFSPKNHFWTIWRSFWIFSAAILIFVHRIFCYFFSLFSHLKITFKQSSGHFKFFLWPFELFVESLSTHKAVETNWSLFFDLSLFSPLKITFKQSGGHFEFFRRPFWIFLAAILNLFCGNFIYLQSFGNKVFFFWFEPFFSPKSPF